MSSKGPSSLTASLSPAPSFDVGEASTPVRTTPGALTPQSVGTPGGAGPATDCLPDSCTGLEARLEYSGNKAVLREAMTTDGEEEGAGGGRRAATTTGLLFVGGISC